MASESSSSGGPMLNIVAAMALFIGGTTAFFLYLLTSQNNDTSQIRWGLVVSLLVFNNINILVAFCEIALGKHIELIKEDYKKLNEKYASKMQHWQGCMDYLLLPLPWDRLFDGRLWCRMWSAYALYDPSYQNEESYGFFVDVGNGWSTIPPCLLMNTAISMPYLCSPLLVGCVCLASYWQIMYGTIIYFLSFIWNKRWEGKKFGEAVTFVGIANGIWMVFPTAAIYACVCILDTKDFSVFGHS